MYGKIIVAQLVLRVVCGSRSTRMNHCIYFREYPIIGNIFNEKYMYRDLSRFYPASGSGINDGGDYFLFYNVRRILVFSIGARIHHTFESAN